MSDAEKAVMAKLDAHLAENFETCILYTRDVRALKAMLAEPRLPKEPSVRAFGAIWSCLENHGTAGNADNVRAIYRALYAHLRAAGDDNQHGQTGFTQASVIASTPIENPELRTALSTLRGWSAEAAGRSGLKDSILLVCNAAESTLPVTLYRIRARGLDAIHAGPVSVSEVGHE